MSRKYILYAHDGSGNHGCEALVRSTAGLLNVDKEHLVLVSASPEEDVYYGIDQLCTVIKKGTRGTVSKTDPAFIRGYLKLKIQKDYLPLDRLEKCTVLAQGLEMLLFLLEEIHIATVELLSWQLHIQCGKKED